MKRLLAQSLITFGVCIPAWATPCVTATLSTYLNGGSLYSCSESSGLDIAFNNTLLPSYVGLSLLSSNNTAVNPSAITVTPSSAGLYFSSNGFTETSILASSQSELVHFSVFSAGTNISSTTFSLTDPATSAGGLGLGTGLAIGQELVCIGGSFTSLPVGLVTSVANGVLGTGAFGCSGAVLVGTAAVSSGPLNSLTGLLGLPSLTGLTDSALIDVGSYNTHTLDVIKILGLVTVTGGSASVDGFGDSFALADAEAPEPGAASLLLGGLAMASLARRWRRKN